MASAHAPRQSSGILTSILATIGPASESPDTIRKLILAGARAFRFNFSHGDFDAHRRRLDAVRAVAADLALPVACVGDLQGPKIRVGLIPDSVGDAGRIDLAPGQDIVFKKGIPAAAFRMTDSGSEPVVPVTYEPLIDAVAPGHKVLLNDGAIRLLAIDRDSHAGELRCRVVVGGPLTSKKGINLPNTPLPTRAITDRDWECVAWALQHALDYLALSFVRDDSDVLELKRRLDKASDAGGPWIPVIAKIEMPQAVADLDQIVAASDAIMVARGDLGVEMDIAQVPVVQRKILATCREHGKPSIIATQMLETMISNPTPTRAEASDVANAIFDGADSVMLSAETATGKHPVLVVETMARIIAAAEGWVRDNPRPRTPPTRLAAAHTGTAALAHGAWDMARDLAAKAVVTWSQNAGTARYLSQNRFDIPIVAYSSDDRSCRRMALFRGVIPVLSRPPASGSIAEWTHRVDEFLTARELAACDDPVILLAGHPLGQAKKTNTISLHRVGRAHASPEHTA